MTSDQSISNEITKLANNLKMQRLFSEYEYYQKLLKESLNDSSESKENIENIRIRVENIQKVIEYFNKIFKNENVESIDNNTSLPRTDSKKNLRDEVFANFDKIYFKQPWKNLSPYHKTIKIEEYIKTKFSDKDEQTQKSIEALLSELSEKKNIGDNQYVIYDPHQSLILDIPILKLNNNNYYLDYSQKKKIKKSKKK